MDWQNHHPLPFVHYSQKSSSILLYYDRFLGIVSRLPLCVCVCVCVCVCSVAQSCPVLCDCSLWTGLWSMDCSHGLPVMDCSPPGSSVCGILWARILEWGAISFCRGSSQARDRTCVSCGSCFGRQILYPWATWEVQVIYFRTLESYL